MDTHTSTTTTNNHQQPSYRMVALDLDGTLLSDDHQIAEIQVEYLQSLQQKGFTVCLATGRSAPSVYEHIQKLNFPKSIPVVTSNGACGFEMSCWSRRQHDDDSDDNLQEQQHGTRTEASLSPTISTKEIFSQPVAAETVHIAIQLAKDHGFAIQYYYQNSILVNSNTSEHMSIVQKYTDLTGSPITYVSDNFHGMLSINQLPSKLLVLFPESKLSLATHVYSTTLSSNQATIVGGAFDWFIEILHPNVNKGYGLSRMCRHLKIPLSECIAIGDGLNDYEFLQLSGLGIAMKNAKDSLKQPQYANMVSKWTNNENGVMKLLQQLHNDGKLICPKKHTNEGY